MSQRPNLLSCLIEANVFKVGEFKLKTGVLSPIYIDLRCIVAHPELVGDLAKAVRDIQIERDVAGDVVCGVPYTAVPIASVFSHIYNTPMVMKRKEAKDYGTKKMVEGVIQQGASCLVVEDIVTSGSSVIETVEVLRKEGLVVTDCVVVLDRQQGGEQNLKNAGVRLHSLFTISDFFRQYRAMREVEPTLLSSVEQYLKNNNYIPPTTVRKPLLFAARSLATKQLVGQRLLEIASTKESNLCVAIDVVHSKELLRIADTVGPHICLLKTHIDILSDFDEIVAEKLCKLAKEHNFLIMEDRKFADIGNTVMHQYVDGMYHIEQWADIVTVHGIPGSGVLEALKRGSSGRQDRACVLVAEMSSKGALTDSSYSDKTEEMAQGHLDFVIGYVSQKTRFKNKDLIHMCPGVSLASSVDSLGQQYKSPEEAVAGGADILIVGRGICCAEDVVSTTLEYKRRGYAAYVQNALKPESM